MLTGIYVNSVLDFRCTINTRDFKIGKLTLFEAIVLSYVVHYFIRQHYCNALE